MNGFASLTLALRHVSIHLPVVQGLKDVIVPRTVVVAGTGLDEHHVLLHDLPVRTLELHWQGGGSVGSAAPAIGADSTEFSPVGLHTGAARKLELDRLGDFGGADALFALLRETKERREKSMALLRRWHSSALGFLLLCWFDLLIFWKGKVGSLSLMGQFSKNNHDLSWNALN